MFFQINVTPEAKKPLKVRSENDKEQIHPQEHFELVLAPFQPQTRIKLDTTVYDTVKCSLTIRNPSNKNLNVTVTKIPPAERSIVLGASELSVRAESSAELEISWTPQEAGSWRDTLRLTDSRRVKYDVALVTTALGIKKPVKGKSRILGLANTNKNAEVRKTLSSVTRETKRNNLVQSNLPSKRPRLNVTQASNKENVSRIGWTNTFSKSKNVSIQSAAAETDFSPKKIGTVSPKATNSSILRRETYNTGAVKSTNSFQRSHEFSMIMNSTNFNFTPLKTSVSEHREQPEVEFRVETDIAFSPRDIGSIVSPEITNSSILRRETYVTLKNPPTRSEKFAEKRPDDANEDENFVDSLSPRPETRDDEKTEMRVRTEFSIFINDMNFSSPNVSSTAEAMNFSPRGCSTGNRTRPIDGKSSFADGSSLNLAGNDTFDISGTKIADNSTANGTYELSVSPKCSKKLDYSIKPTRLSRSFDPIAPLMKNSVSSTPVCRDASSSRLEKTTRTSIGHVSNRKNYDDVSAREVLEADLWIKSHSDCSPIVESTFPYKRCVSLDRISEEEITTVESVSQAILDRTKTIHAVNNEKSMKFRRIDISPPRKSYARRVSPTKSMKIRKDRGNGETATNLRKKVQLSGPLKRGRVSIPGVRMTHLSLAGIEKSGGGKLKDKSFVRNEPKEISVKLHDPNDFLTRLCNPDPFGASMTRDPFLTSTMYYDEKWINHRAMEFQKWLNALLTPLEDLSADVDTMSIDIGKVWQSCRSREDVALAETREAVSARYHTNTRLNTLRKAACALFRRDEVTAALSKVAICVERGTLTVRQDRDLHRDIGLQKEILELFLSYNPLWLRIGLETIYGETIPLNSNNDLVGLTRFLITRFFSDPFIVKNHSHALVTSLKLPSFDLSMNKFILKKFLLIVYFLDYAKRSKLIGHDPCLFHKRSPHKDSRAILLAFSREILSGVGDLTKILRSQGYVVSHRQTYLDEYDYAVKNIATDLRDGVRLCRVMELISGDKNLICQCRAPAISRLQKVHNANVALSALSSCGYELTGDIDAKSVADGHREKTLSLLWQIIYKYQAPRFEKAATSVQRWWRSKLCYVRIRNFLQKRRDDAASTIQRAWKCRRARKFANNLREERRREFAERLAAIRAIQIYWIRRMRMLEDRRNFIAKRKAALRIQRSFRRLRDTKECVDELCAKRKAARTIQLYWRARIRGRKERSSYLEILEASSKIQIWWRAERLRRRDSQSYRSLRKAALIVQSRWRALRSMRIARESFATKLRAVKIIQSWWHRYLVLKRDRNDYLLKKNAARTIEAWWIERRIVNDEIKRFRAKRAAVLVIQRNLRKLLETREYRRDFREIANACRIVQGWWRSVRIAKRYENEKKCCVIVQRWWRGVRSTRSAKASFVELRSAAIFVQKIWRMKITRRYYRRRKMAVARIEAWRKNVLASRSIRRDFTIKRHAALKLQRWWRNLRIGEKQRDDYLAYRRTIILVQTKRRANILARKTREEYLRMKTAITRIQAGARMLSRRRWYAELRRRDGAARILQKRWREIVVGRKLRKIYVEYRYAAIAIQKRYRELRISRETRSSYLRKRRAAIVVQKNWRMLRASRNYAKQRKAALVLQTRWRARIKCIEIRENFLVLREATIRIQLRWISKRKALRARDRYLKLRRSVLAVQRKWRANKSMRAAKKYFLLYRSAAISLQSQWRMILARRAYAKIVHSILTIQRRWRAVKIARKTRKNWEILRRTIFFVQRRYRAKKLGKICRDNYAKTRKNVIFIQRLWRKKLVDRMRDEAAINIQTWWKSILAMRECKKRYEILRFAVLVIQRRYRARKLAIETRRDYLRIVGSAMIIQRGWRCFMKRRRDEEWLRERKIAVSSIENWWIVILRRKREREAKLAKLRRENDAATRIQSAWRGYAVRTSQSSMMKELRQRFESAAKAAVPSATVAFQLRESIDMLLGCDTIGQLSMCLTQIDTLTRLSLKGCITFCELNLVEKIYWTIYKSNRSIPWLDVCLRCTSILITLTKLPDTKKYTHRVEFIETLARLLNIAVDHHVNLFLHLATLLWLLSENPEYANAITSCPRTTWLLSTLNATINKKRSNKPSLGNPNGKSQAKEQTAQLPNTKPDWGIKHKRPRLFTTVHHAISSLIKRLKIDTAT